MVDVSKIRTDWEDVSEADWQVNNAKAQANKITAEPLNALGLGVIEALSQSGTSVTVNDDGTATVDTADTSVRVATVTPGKNLYNPADPDVAPGFFLAYTTGALVAGASYTTTGFVAITPGDTYSVSSARQIVWYTAAHTHISGLDDITNGPHTVTAPGTAAFMRVAVINTNLPTFQIEQGPTVTAHEPYQVILSGAAGQYVTATATATATTAAAGALTAANTYTDSAIAAIPIPEMPASALEAVAAMADMAEAQLNIAVISDSTANDDNDWVRLLTMLLDADLDDTLRREYIAWDATASAWKAPVVDHEGTGGTPASGGLVIGDTFNRTAADLGGAPGTSGPSSWAASTSGGWSANGTHAVPNAQNGTLSVNAGQKSMTVEAVVRLVTTGTGATQTLRMEGATVDRWASGKIGAHLNVTGAGVPIIVLYFASSPIGGTGVTLPTGKVPHNSATPVNVTMKLVIDGPNVTYTLTTPDATVYTITATLDSTQEAGLGTFTGLRPSTATFPAFSLDSVTVNTPLTPATFKGMVVHNGAVAGWRFSQFTTAHLVAAFPTAQDYDVLIVSGGHNHVGQTPTAYLAELEALLARWEALHPGTLLLVSSQNPQYGTGEAPAHKARQAALRSWVMDRGFDYIPAMEAFLAQPDGGASLVPDGTHPSGPWPVAPEGDYGSVLWAQAAFDAINARRFR